MRHAGRRATRALLLSALLAAASPAGAQAQSQPAEQAGASIEIAISGVASRVGKLLVVLYDREEHWLDLDQAVRVLRVEPRPPVTRVRLDGLAPGTYAVGVIHDENENDELDFAFFPYPHIEEAAAMSNNPTARFGPPSFEQSRFELPAGGIALEIRLQR